MRGRGDSIRNGIKERRDRGAAFLACFVSVQLLEDLKAPACFVCFEEPDIVKNRDPIACPRCQKPFCRQCIAKWLSGNDTCPTCKTSIEEL